LISKPNCGKSTLIKNFLLKANPPFRKIYLAHPALRQYDDDIDDTIPDDVVKEYKELDYIPLNRIPPPKFFDNGCKKQCLILDDLELKNISKEEKSYLNKILSYSSTHYNLTIMTSSQDTISQMPVSVLRFCNVFCLWNYSELNYMTIILTRIGIGKKRREKVLNVMSKFGPHDFLMLDYTVDSPAMVRKNGYEVLDI
jgi:hypothetical protein